MCHFPNLYVYNVFKYPGWLELTYIILILESVHEANTTIIIYDNNVHCHFKSRASTGDPGFFIIGHLA